ncbi:MAG: glycosyltransferase [Chloroflexi bacterium]|jgi:spore maturation protein CgeB|nr:glycosyltransferase [Chloroflexota bacterium]
MNNYKGAMYQRDVMEEFANQTDVIFYGPGFEGFEPTESIESAIQRMGGADLLIVGHAWLYDLPGAPVDEYPELHLEDCSIPKVVILNKEYTNLEAKLRWIRDKNFMHGFSHHHDVGFYEEKTGVCFTFWPFAFKEGLFGKQGQEPKDIDFAFSGLLKNTANDTGQSDARILVMRRLFHCIGDIPVVPRRRYKSNKIFWNAIARKFWQRRLAVYLSRYRFLSDLEYASLQRRSRVYLNTLSPAGLVSPRFSENMASKALVFCEESDNIKRIFPSNCYITFRSDLGDFEEKFEMAVSDGDERTKIVEYAYDLAMTEHTWKVRVNDMLKIIHSS